VDTGRTDGHIERDRRFLDGHAVIEDQLEHLAHPLSRPALDLGFLLHKHPEKGQSFPVTAGAAHVFYPEATPGRCTAALLLEVDPIALVRGKTKTSDGELAADVRPLVRFNVSVLVEQNGRREQGYAGAGGRYSLAELVAGERPLALAREAVRQALVNLEAVPAPAATAARLRVATALAGRGGAV